MTADNIILDKGGSNQVTVYTARVVENWNKKLSLITPAQSSANWASGPKTTKIIDLQKIENRLTVNGSIDKADKSKCRDVLEQGGVVVLEWEGEDFNVNLEKLEVATDVREDDHKEIVFTCVVGVDI